jgi:hypothetical protein
VSGAGVVVADPRGRARVIARTDRGAPAPLGTAGGRMARWAGPDAVAVTGLRADDPLQVVVHDVATSSRVGPDGSLWLHSDLDPPETVRRLDLAARDGTQVLSATYLPVVTIQNPRGEGLVDVNTVLPVAGGALRVADVAGAPQLQRLTETAEGIAATPIAGTADPTCRPSASGAATALAGLVVGGVRTLAADRSGAWFPITGPDGDRLAHLAPDGTLRAVGPPLPGRVAALGDGGDGSLLLIAHGGDGDLLWRLPDPEAALTDLPAPSPACDPAH